jgi:hypothetical protein
MKQGNMSEESKKYYTQYKKELGTQMKTPKNIEISKNGSIIQDPETIANVFNDY